MDVDTLIQLRAEDTEVRKWEKSEYNRILRPETRNKQNQWNNVFPKLALEGLSEEELSLPY